MKTHFGKAGALSLLAASLTLAGCGGGGGGSTAAALPTIGGVAAKGLMQNALVTAYCGPQGANNSVGTAYTDANGAYSLTLTAACAQPVVVVVGVNPSPTTAHPATTMLDEVQGSVTPPANFVLRAIVPSVTSGTITQPVTPLSDMAAAVALSAVTNNTLTAAQVGNANQAIINTVLGGNAAVFNAVPVPPAQYSATTTSAAQQQLAVVLAGISATAQQNTGNAGAAIQTAVQAMSTAAAQSVSVTANGYAISANQPATLPVATIASGMTALANGTVTLNTSANGAPSTAVAQAIASPTNINSLQTSIVPASQNQIAAGGSVSVSAPPTSVATAIASAKSLIQAIRTDLIGLGNSANNGFLQQQSTQMASDMTTAGALLGYDIGKQLTAIQQALLLAADVTRTPNALGTAPGTPGSATVLTSGETLVTVPPQVAVFGKYYQRTFGTINTSNYMQCRAYVTAGTGVTATVGTINRTSLLKTGDYLATVCTYYPYANDLSREAHFAVHQTSTSLASATLNYGNLIRTYAAGACSYYQATCNATDALTGPFYTTGTISVAVSSIPVIQNGVTSNVQTLSQITLPANSQLISLDGTNPAVVSLNAQIVAATQTSTSSQYTFNISGSVATAATNPGATAQINSGSYVQVDTTSGAASVNFLASLQTAAFKYDGTFNGAVTGANGATNAAIAPSNFSFTGVVSTVANGVATPFLNVSRLIADASAKTAGLTATVIKAGAQTQIAGTVDASAADHLSSTMSFIVPGYTFTATGVSYPSLSSPSTLTVTSSDGTKFSLTRSTSNVTTTVVTDTANETLGTVVGNNQLNFVDGSYVILN